MWPKKWADLYILLSNPPNIIRFRVKHRLIISGSFLGGVNVTTIAFKNVSISTKKRRPKATCNSLNNRDHRENGMGTHLNERSILENNNTCLRTFEYHFLRMSFTQFYYDVLGSAVANAISLGVANRAPFLGLLKK